MSLFSGRGGRRLFRKIANKYNLIYFGHVNPKVDTDYKMVRGVTISPNVCDENYTVGNIDGYEAVFLQRSHSVEVARNKWTKYEWTILQLTINDASLPHIFVDCFYRRSSIGNLLMSVLRLPEIAWQNFSPNEQFSKTFTLYAHPHAIQDVRKIFAPEFQKELIEKFYMFDYELFDDKVIIYATNQKIDSQTLDNMLRVGLSMTQKINNRH